MNDTERLNWLETQKGFGVISDDFGRWAVPSCGTQTVPEDISIPNEIHSTFFVSKDDWYPSVRAAIDAAMATQSDQQDSFRKSDDNRK